MLLPIPDTQIVMKSVPVAWSQRERSKLARVKRILEATSRILAKDGYAALNMNDIAEAADVTPPTIFNLVGRKEDLLLSLSYSALDQLRHAIVMPPTGASTSDIAHVLDAYTDVLARDEQMYRALHIAMETLQSQGSNRSEINKQFQEAGLLLTQTLEPFTAHPKMKGHITLSSIRASLSPSIWALHYFWAHGRLTTKQLRQELKRNYFTVLAADAKPQFQRELLEQLALLPEISFAAPTS